MSWTTDPPNEPGYYWISQKGDVELVEIRGEERRYQRIYGEHFYGLEVDEIEDEWRLLFWPERITPPPAAREETS